jgi:hypothetical protein
MVAFSGTLMNNSGMLNDLILSLTEKRGKMMSNGFNSNKNNTTVSTNTMVILSFT